MRIEEAILSVTLYAYAMVRMQKKTVPAFRFEHSVQIATTTTTTTATTTNFNFHLKLREKGNDKSRLPNKR